MRRSDVAVTGAACEFAPDFDDERYLRRVTQRGAVVAVGVRRRAHQPQGVLMGARQLAQGGNVGFGQRAQGEVAVLQGQVVLHSSPRYFSMRSSSASRSRLASVRPSAAESLARRSSWLLG